MASEACSVIAGITDEGVIAQPAVQSIVAITAIERVTLLVSDDRVGTEVPVTFSMLIKVSVESGTKIKAPVEARTEPLNSTPVPFAPLRPRCTTTASAVSPVSKK